jgi:hypothetical protein
MPDVGRLLEELAGRLRALAFDIGEQGVSAAGQVEAVAVTDAVIGAVERAKA